MGSSMLRPSMITGSDIFSLSLDKSTSRNCGHSVRIRTASAPSAASSAVSLYARSQSCESRAIGNGPSKPTGHFGVVCEERRASKEKRGRRPTTPTLAENVPSHPMHAFGAEATTNRRTL